MFCVYTWLVEMGHGGFSTVRIEQAQIICSPPAPANLCEPMAQLKSRGGRVHDCCRLHLPSVYLLRLDFLPISLGLERATQASSHTSRRGRQ